MANAQKIKAIVTSVTSHGNHVYSLSMKTEKKMPRFRAGQFLHLTLEEFDRTAGFWPESRVFSIASATADRKEVAIVYSVKGVYTKKMEEVLREGTEVWLKGPYGDFIIANHIQKGDSIMLVAGGTGISPFIPFLKELPSRTDVVLNYGLKHIGLLIFEEELNEALSHEHFMLNLYLEQPADTSLSLAGKVSMREGMLSIPDMLEKHAERENLKVFLSGPPEMIRLFKTQCIEAFIPDENILIDEWS